MTLRCIVVDDEPPARDLLRLMLQDQANIELVAECATGPQAVVGIREHRPDLVFLDIQMPGLDGFRVIEEIGIERMPSVVFVTAYDEFALRAFEAHALDYLLKPFDDERFRRALERVRVQLRGRSRRKLEERLINLLHARNHDGPRLERLVVRSNGRILILRVEDIDWIEAAANYVRLHVAGKSYLMRETMVGIESRLDPAQFVRVHRSTIVRIDRIKELEPLFQGDYLIVLQDGSRLTSSRGYRTSVQRILEGSPT
jgi:two-component system, LytTR family, response regulator